MMPTRNRSLLLIPTISPTIFLTIAASFSLACLAQAQETQTPSHEHAHHAAGHVHPAAAAAVTDQAAVTRSNARYDASLALVRADGKAVNLADELDGPGPVILNFVFTSCTAVCPVSSHIFALIQEQLAQTRQSAHLVSISIDPEQDTPARLRAYSKTYGATSEWRFYTGTPAQSIAAQRAFGVYRGDKMNHSPVTFVRTAPGQPWVRLDGFAGVADVMAELPRAVATN